MCWATRLAAARGDRRADVRGVGRGLPQVRQLLRRRHVAQGALPAHARRAQRDGPPHPLLVCASGACRTRPRGRREVGNSWRTTGDILRRLALDGIQPRPERQAGGTSADQDTGTTRTWYNTHTRIHVEHAHTCWQPTLRACWCDCESKSAHGAHSMVRFDVVLLCCSSRWATAA